jgi:hypothetical protein
MPYKDTVTEERGRATLRARNRAFIDEVNARTMCAHCGAQPVEWHNPEHVELNRRIYRIGDMACRTFSLEAIKAEIGRCTPLCRRCHMTEDGRMGNLPKGRPLVPPRPCTNCGRLSKPLRKGLCTRCYDRQLYAARKQRRGER